MFEKIQRFIYSNLLAFRERKSTAALLTVGNELLAQKFGPGVRLKIEGRPVRGATYRCRLLGAPDQAPSSIFLKKGRPGAGSFDPLDTDPNGPSCRLFNDWTGLRFMQSLFPGELHAPEWLTGDRSLGFYISGEVGEHSLTDLLQGTDTGGAEHALLATGKLLGQMHARSYGRREEYEHLRSLLGPSGKRQEIWGTGPWMRDTLKELQANFANIGFEPSPAFYRDLDGVAAAFEEPGPFLVFTHNDLGPENLRLTAGYPYLIDFEFAGFRHAMTDGAYFRMLFPTCWRVRAIPAKILDRVESEYRTALAVGCQAANEDDLYQQAFLDGCAYWLAVSLRFALELPQGHSSRTSAVDQDKKWGHSTLRQIICGRVDAFLEVSEGAGTHQGLRETCLRLRDHLHRTWGRLEMVPTFPALRPLSDGISRNASDRLIEADGKGA